MLAPAIGHSTAEPLPGGARAALFLSHFPVTALPAMSSGAALVSLFASLLFARGMVRLTPARKREPLEIALRAVRTDDEALRGTALEYLDNVLPEPVRKALWPRLSAEGRPRASGRSTEEIRDDLLRSTAALVSQRSRGSPA